MTDKSALWGDWKAYFQALKNEQEEPNGAEALVDEPIVILEPGRELSEIEMRALKGSLGALIKRLIGRGWDIRVGRSVAQMPPVRFVADSDTHSRGDIRYPGYVAENYEVFAWKKTQRDAFGLHCSWIGKDGGTPKLVGAETIDPILGRAWRPQPSSPRPQRAWEKEEGVAPPASLNQWLKIVAPTPAEIKKKQQMKEAA